MEIENINIDNKKKYNSKQYYQNFKEKHKDTLKETIKCDLCGGSYKYFNKPIHLKTKKHLEYVNGEKQPNKNNVSMDILLKLPIQEQIQILLNLHNINNKCCDEIIKI